MNDPIIQLLDWLGPARWIVYLVLIAVVVNGLVNGLASTVESVRKLSAFVQRKQLSSRALQKRANRVSASLIDLVQHRQDNRPLDDPIIKDHEKPHRRVTKHDEQTQSIFLRDYAPELARLRAEFLSRGVQDDMFDAFHTSIDNNEDIKTLASQLSSMANRVD